MNLLNLILSGIVSGTMSYFSIKNLSKNKFNVKNMLTYVLILIPLLLVVYICFDGITRLLLNIIFIEKIGIIKRFASYIPICYT